MSPSSPSSASNPRSGIVTLTTDFGRGAAYVGSLKGALLSVDPRVTIVDLSHDVTPYSILEAALLLRAAAPAFPAGTVHLAVVDPGVGGPRRPLIVSTDRALFVGPDNGLFTPFLVPGHTAYEIEPAHAPAALSATFHGRDLFAPVAARLAGGARASDFGAPVPEPVRLDWPAPRREGAMLLATVLHVDGYGNLITSVALEDLPSAPVEVQIAGETIRGIARTYADRPDGTLLALVGSSGLLEVAVARGHAAAALDVAAGAPVRVVLAP